MFDRGTRWALLLSFGAVPFMLLGPMDYLTGARGTDLLTVTVGAAALAFPYVGTRLGIDSLPSARKLALASGLLGLFVLATGIFNGQTWEPYTTPRYASLILAGQNPYTTPLTFSFVLCSGPSTAGWVVCVPHVSSTYYVYLPLLALAQLPGVTYEVTTFLAWVGLVYLVRYNAWALLALGGPFVALSAANGYNDLPILLLLTLGFVATDPRIRSAARWLSLGFKQFANLFLFVYYIARREYWKSVAAVLVTALFLLPYALGSPRGLACPTILHETANCTPGAGADLFSHLNYWLWPLWAVALFPGAPEAFWRGLREWAVKVGAGRDGAHSR